MDFLQLFARWASEGAIVFGIGLIPLFITSQSLLASLTMFGTGWLVFHDIVTFLGRILIGAVSITRSSPQVDALSISPTAAAIAHVAGVLVMFIAERRLSSRMLHASPSCGLDSETPSSSTIATPHDMEPRKTERTNDLVAQVLSAPGTTRLGVLGPHQRRFYLFIFAFVAEAIASGITAGYVAMAPPWKFNVGRDDIDNPTPALSMADSILVYLLLSLFRKGITTLGFVTTLLSASLPIAECKQHVRLYAIACPLTAVLSYTVTVLLGIIPTDDRPYILTMCSFTDGLRIYAGLIVRALIVNSHTTTQRGLLARMLLMAAGALLPHILTTLVLFCHLWYTGKPS